MAYHGDKIYDNELCLFSVNQNACISGTSRNQQESNVRYETCDNSTKPFPAPLLGTSTKKEDEKQRTNERKSLAKCFCFIYGIAVLLVSASLAISAIGILTVLQVRTEMRSIFQNISQDIEVLTVTANDNRQKFQSFQIKVVDVQKDVKEFIGGVKKHFDESFSNASRRITKDARRELMVGLTQIMQPSRSNGFLTLLGLVGGRCGQDRGNHSIRLIDGKYSYEGRVEIYHDGEWGTVCDDSWDINDAIVVCRMLGFRNATSAPQRAQYREGNGQIWLDEVNCLGSESSIIACPSNNWGCHDCTHSEDAWVVCTP